MKKILLPFALLFFIKPAFAQNAQWSAWTSVSCYKGIQYSINNLGYNKSTKNYWWNVRWRNSYSKPVSFDGEVIIDGENSIHGGFGVIQPGGTQQYTSVPYRSGSTNFAVNVTKVCFADKYGGCSANIPGYPNYANCDNGVPNYTINPQAAGGSQQVSATSSNTTGTYAANTQANSSAYWSYYNQATAAGKVGNYDLAISNWEAAIRNAVNDAQRDNAKAWLAEVQKAKSAAAGSSYQTQRTQTTYTPPQQNNAQTQAAALNQLSNSLMDIARSIDQAKAEKRAKERQAAAALQAQQDEERRRVEAANADRNVYDLPQYVGQPGQHFKNYFSNMGAVFVNHVSTDTRNADVFDRFTITHYTTRSDFEVQPGDEQYLVTLLNHLVGLREYIACLYDGQLRRNVFALTNTKDHSNKDIHTGIVTEDYDRILKAASTPPQTAPVVPEKESGATNAGVVPVNNPYTPSEKRKKASRSESSRCEFDGDLEAFLSKNVIYPSIARENNIQGTVGLLITIGKDGSVTEVKAVQGPTELYESAENAIRKSSGMWIPTRQNNKFFVTKTSAFVKYSLP